MWTLFLWLGIFASMALLGLALFVNPDCLTKYKARLNRILKCFRSRDSTTVATYFLTIFTAVLFGATMNLVTVESEHSKADHRLQLGNALIKVVEDFDNLPAIRACIRYVNNNSKYDSIFLAGDSGNWKEKDFIYVVLALDHRPQQEGDFSEDIEDKKTCLAAFHATHPRSTDPRPQEGSLNTFTSFDTRADYAREEYGYIREQLIKYNNILDIVSKSISLESLEAKEANSELSSSRPCIGLKEETADVSNRDIDSNAIDEIASMVKYSEEVELINKWFVRLTTQNDKTMEDEFPVCKVTRYHRNCNLCVDAKAVYLKAVNIGWP